MARYIDTTKLLWIYEHECEKYSGLDEMVADVPTEDVVEVVRCKDCRWWKTNYYWNGRECKVCVKEAYTPIRTPDDFCSRGERGDDAEIH